MIALLGILSILALAVICYIYAVALTASPTAGLLH